MREAWNPMGPKKEAHFQAKNLDRKIEGRNYNREARQCGKPTTTIHIQAEGKPDRAAGPVTDTL